MAAHISTRAVIEPDSVYNVTMPIRPLSAPVSSQKLYRLERYNLLAGGALAILGVIALIYPLFYQKALGNFIGYFLIVAGVVTGIHTVAICGAPSTIPVGLIAIIHLFVGSMFVAPRKGALEEKIALTVVLPLWFLALGFAKIFQSAALHPIATWPFVMVSGVASIVFAITVWGTYPNLASWQLCLFVGSEFLITALALVFVSYMAHFGVKLMELWEEEEVQNRSMAQP